MKKVLFVCLGNICRSPMGEAIMKSMVRKEGLQNSIFCDSAGTSDYHVGDKADHRMRSHAKKRGYNITHLGRQIDPSNDFSEFDYIIAMDQSNYRNIKTLDFNNELEDKLFHAKDFCTSHKINGVPDPYYGGDEGFQLVIDILENVCENMLNEIKSEL